MDYTLIKNIIIDQREEVDHLLKEQKVIDRVVLSEYSTYLKSKQVKVITGPRRSGKSTLALQLLKNTSYAYINFDDENLISATKEDLNLVLKAFYELYGTPEYIFLDEIQNIEGWELFVNRLKRIGFNLIISGSNANLLSQELATHLTGRHISLLLLPFSFHEYLRFFDQEILKLELSTPEIARIQEHLARFIEIGGFPEIYTEPNPKKYLISLYTSIVSKDIVARHQIKYIKTLRELAHYLLSNFSCMITFNKLKNIFGFKNVLTAQNYLSYLEESYCIFLIERFSYKHKERITAPRKVYAYDTGLANALSTRILDDLGRFYENSVACELMRRNAYGNEFDIYYWQDYQNREIDFVIRKDQRVIELIQVCYTIENYDTRMRELRSFSKATKELNCNQCTVITSDKEGTEKFESITVAYIPLWKWLLR